MEESGILNYKIIFLISCAGLLSGCIEEAFDSTRQDVRKASLLEVGMSQAKVVELLGLPVSQETTGEGKVFHYCSTGSEFDEVAVLALKSDRLIAVKNYIITLHDTGGKTGDCSTFLKTVDLTQTISSKEITFR